MKTGQQQQQKTGTNTKRVKSVQDMEPQQQVRKQTVQLFPHTSPQTLAQIMKIIWKNNLFHTNTHKIMKQQTNQYLKQYHPDIWQKIGKQQFKQLLHKIPVSKNIVQFLEAGQYHNLSLVSKKTKQTITPHAKQLPINQQISYQNLLGMRDPKQFIKKILQTTSENKQQQRRHLAQKIKKIALTTDTENIPLNDALKMTWENLSGFVNLETLEFLDYYPQTGDDWRIIAEQMSQLKHLKTLDFDNPEPADEFDGYYGPLTFRKDTKVIADAISSIPTLENLSFNNPQCSEESIMPLIHSIGDLPNLQTFKLSGNPEGGNAGAAAFANIKNPPPHLRSFIMTKNNIGDPGAVGISKFLTNSFQLEYLDVSRNQIRDHGLVAICSILPNLRHLKELFLQQNPIADVGARALSSVFGYMPALEILNLDETQIGWEGISSITNNLHLLPKLKSLSYSNPQITDMIYTDAISHEFSLMFLRNKENRNFKLERIYLSKLKIRDNFLSSLYNSIKFFLSSFPSERKMTLVISGSGISQKMKNDLARDNQNPRFSVYLT